MTDDSDRKTHDTNESVAESADEPMKADGGTTQSGWMTRRSALASIGATAALGSVGTAAATEVHADDPADNLDDAMILPGDDVPVLDLTLESSDEVIDVSGGPDDGGDRLTRGYGAVTSNHPQPHWTQDVIPADVLLPFTTGDRVYSSSTSDFDLDDEHLFQAAGAVEEGLINGFSKTRTTTDGSRGEIDPSDTYTRSDPVYPTSVRFAPEYVGMGYSSSRGWVTKDYVDTLKFTEFSNGVYGEQLDDEDLDDMDYDRPRAYPVGTRTVHEAEDGEANPDEDYNVPDDDEFDVNYDGWWYKYADISTDISEVINPQLSVKVDSVGAGQEEIVEDDHSLPVYASDVDGIDDGSPETILVDASGNVPEEIQERNGYDVSYSGGTLTITFHEHRTDVTLSNSGWLSGVRTPYSPSADALRDADDPFNATSGCGATNSVGLADDFWPDSVSENDLVKIDSNDIAGVDVDNDVYQVVTAYEPDTPDLHNNTAFLSGVGVFNVPGEELAGADVILQDDPGASEETVNILGSAGDYEDVVVADNGYLQIPVDGNANPDDDVDVGDPLKVRAGDTGADGGNLISRAELRGEDIRNQTHRPGVLSRQEAVEKLPLEDDNGVVEILNEDLGDEGATTALAGSRARAPVQLLAEGTYDGDGTNGSPLEETTVDLTRSPMLDYVVDGDQYDSTVDENGVFHPHSEDIGLTVPVEVYFNGEEVDTVEIDVEQAQHIDWLDDEVEVHTVDFDNNDVGAGSSFQVVATTEAELEGEPVTIDVTRAFTEDEDENIVPVATFDFVGTHGDNEIGDDGFVETDGSTTVSELTVEVESFVEDGSGVLWTDRPVDIDALDVDTASETFNIVSEFYIEAAGVPGRAIYEGSEELVIVKAENSTRGDGSEIRAPVDDIFLDDPVTIAEALEVAINEAVEANDAIDYIEGDAVSACWGPETDHSARGYIVRSNTEVESSFDQGVDVSSVEIGSIHELVIDEVIDPENLERIDGGLLKSIERQEIEAALGLGFGDWNSVTAATVAQGDIYYPRADPLAQVEPNNENVEFLGDVELTCNDIELGYRGWLLGTEGVSVIRYYPSDYPYADFQEELNIEYGDLETDAGDEVDAGQSAANIIDDIVEDENGDFSVGDYEFVEAFDIVEVKDAIFDESTAPVGTPETLIRDSGEDGHDDGVDRGLPREDEPTSFSRTFLVYGDRFDGLAVRNEGTIDLDEVNEHVLEVVNDVERDWINAGMAISIIGSSQAPLWPNDRPDLVRFIGDDDGLADEVLDEAYAEGSRQTRFTDDHGNEIWFGTDGETTCGESVDDYVHMIVTAAVSNSVDEGETLDYEIPDLYDQRSNGKYNVVPASLVRDGVSANYQDRGIFFESLDDQGDISGDIGLVTIGEDIGADITENYDPENSTEVSAAGMRDAVSDWRDGEIDTAQLRQVLNAWREA